MPPRRPTRDEVAAAHGRIIPDVLPPPGGRLSVLFCGINPGLYSGATGLHFARPGNRFWPALHGSGFTDRLLAPHEQHLLPSYGLGITNLVARATARADELTPAELVAGAGRLRALIAGHAPSWLAVAGVTAYRTAFARPRAAIGRQDDRFDPGGRPGGHDDRLGPGGRPGWDGRAGSAGIWVLPNPSGLNASWPLPRIVGEFAALRAAIR